MANRNDGVYYFTSEKLREKREEYRLLLGQNYQFELKCSMCYHNANYANTSLGCSLWLGRAHRLERLMKKNNKKIEKLKAELLANGVPL